MYRLFLSFRYFRSRPVNVIPVICMTLGVMALIVILAVMDGFQAQLKQTLRGSLSDLTIRVYYDSDFEKWVKVLSEVDGVVAVAPHLESFSLVSESREGVDTGPLDIAIQKDGALVLGIVPEREAEVSSFRRYLRMRVIRDAVTGETEWISSTPDPEQPFAVLQPRWEDKPGIILGRPLARRLGISFPPRPDPRIPGAYRYQRVFLTTVVRTDDPKEKYRPRQWDFCVTGFYESGNQDLDQHIAFVDRSVAKRFFELAVDPQEIRIRLEDYRTQHAAVKRELVARMAEIYTRTAKRNVPWRRGRPYSVLTWEDRRKNFIAAIDNEKGLIAIIAGMAFIVTGFMIFSILSMVVTMKTRDIGIIKALGGTTGGVVRIFLLNGFISGLLGSLAGLGLGLLFTSNINWVRDRLNDLLGVDPFPKDIYLFNEIPTRVNPHEVAIVTGLAIAVALLGSILPALKAGRLDPVESLRYE